jgi:hypothetical protein
MFLEVAWDYFVENLLWKPRFSSLQAFERHIDFDNTIKPALERAKQRYPRLAKQTASIVNRWSCSGLELLPHNIAPPTYTEKFVRQLNRLSKVCNREDAVNLLKDQIKSRLVYHPLKNSITYQIKIRLSNYASGARKNSHVVSGDIQVALLVIEQRSLELPLSAPVSLDCRVMNVMSNFLSI